MINVRLKVKIPWQNIDINESRNFNNNLPIEAVLAELGIGKKDEGNFLVAVNGKIEYKDYQLQDGDEISILPSLIGG